MTRSSNLQSEATDSPAPWVIEYGTLSIDCRNEDDAKTIARGLRHRGRLIVRTAFGVSPARRFEDEDLTMWLSE